MNIKALARAIQDSPLNKFQIAEKSGISRTTLDNVLSGADVKVSTIESICNTVGIAPASLFDGEVNFVGQSEQDYLDEISRLKCQLAEAKKKKSTKVVVELDVEESEFVKLGLKDKIIKVLEQ